MKVFKFKDEPRVNDNDTLKCIEFLISNLEKGINILMFADLDSSEPGLVVGKKYQTAGEVEVLINALKKIHHNIKDTIHEDTNN